MTLMVLKHLNMDISWVGQNKVSLVNYKAVAFTTNITKSPKNSGELLCDCI